MTVILSSKSDSSCGVSVLGVSLLASSSGSSPSFSIACCCCCSSCDGVAIVCSSFGGKELSSIFGVASAAAEVLFASDSSGRFSFGERGLVSVCEKIN